jgi:hypothetical protein
MHVCSCLSVRVGRLLLHHPMPQFLKAKASATFIQASFKGFKGRSEYENMRAAAIMFQAAIRRCRARKDYLDKKKAAVAIQARARSHFARAEYEEMRRLAIRFQVGWCGCSRLLLCSCITIS